MKKTLLLLALAGGGAYAYFKSKVNAWDKVEISLKKFRITGFAGTDLKCTLTASLKNPTSTPLSFDAIEGTVLENGNKLSVFQSAIGKTIAPKTSTDIDINILINILKLAKSVIDLITGGFKTQFLIDSITTVGAIKIPVRQVFDIDFGKVTGEIVNSVAPGGESADFDLPSPPPPPTPTITQPELFDTSGSDKKFISANAVGDIDPTGGVVITMEPPVGSEDINNKFANIIIGDGKSVMILPKDVPIYDFNPGSGYTIGARRKTK